MNYKHIIGIIIPILIILLFIFQIIYYQKDISIKNNSNLYPNLEKSNINQEEFNEQKQKTYDIFLSSVLVFLGVLTILILIFGLIFYSNIHEMEDKLVEKARDVSKRMFENWTIQEFKEDRKELKETVENQNTKIDDLTKEVERIKLLNKLKPSKSIRGKDEP